MTTCANRSTSLDEKLQIYQATSTRYSQWYADQAEHGGRCFYWSLTLMGVLLQKGYRALIQAGSMSWPIVPAGQDDGKSPTHFSYEWSPWREESQAALKLGLLPEIHVWVGLPDQNELLDFTTKFLPEQAAKERLSWRTHQPPDFLWCGPSELPEGVIYKPDLAAIGFILERIHKSNHRQNGGKKGESCRTGA
jgi:hypothetical protein